MKISTKTDKETFTLAKDFANQLKGGEVIGLVGNLGAGKTVFSQGIAKSLKIKNKVTSPTFVVMKVYAVEHPTIKQFCHIDSYRLTSGEDLASIGALDYFNATDCVTVVEWADRVKDILPKKTKLIKIKIVDDGRIFTL